MSGKRRRFLGACDLGALAVLALMAVLVLVAVSSASGRTGAAPTLSTEPSISGVPLQGNSLHGNRGTWSGTAPISYSYAWLRCNENAESCTSVSGATTTAYTLIAADIGSTMRFRVTAKNAEGSKGADSNATGVVGTPGGEPASSKPPVISGFAEVGVNLHTTTGTWVGTTPITYSYQWQRCDTEGNACKAVSGAKSSGYTVTSTDSGKTLRVKVTATNSKGKSSAISEQTAVVTGGSGGGGANSVSVNDVPASERLVVDQVVFSPNPVKSRNTPIEIRIRVKDTRGKLVRGAFVFVRSTPILTSTPTDAQTGADGWVTYHVSPRADFPLKTGYNVQFYVKAYKQGDPTLAGIYGSRLVQVATVKP